MRIYGTNEKSSDIGRSKNAIRCGSESPATSLKRISIGIACPLHVSCPAFAAAPSCFTMSCSLSLVQLPVWIFFFLSSLWTRQFIDRAHNIQWHPSSAEQTARWMGRWSDRECSRHREGRQNRDSLLDSPEAAAAATKTDENSFRDFNRLPLF